MDRLDYQRASRDVYNRKAVGLLALQAATAPSAQVGGGRPGSGRGGDGEGECDLFLDSYVVRFCAEIVAAERYSTHSAACRQP